MGYGGTILTPGSPHGEFSHSCVGQIGRSVLKSTVLKIRMVRELFIGILCYDSVCKLVFTIMIS